MAELGRQLGFGPKQLGEAGVLGQVGSKLFDRHLSTQTQVGGLMNLGGRPGAYSVTQSIPVAQRPGRGPTGIRSRHEPERSVQARTGGTMVA